MLYRGCFIFTPLRKKVLCCLFFGAQYDIVSFNIYYIKGLVVNARFFVVVGLVALIEFLCAKETNDLKTHSQQNQLSNKEITPP